MSRYIDADELHLKKGELSTYSEFGIGYNDGIKFCQAEIDRTPTADVVEVVRCKDCKHWSDYIHPIVHTATCFALSVFDKIQTNSEQWCCYGERKEE